MASLWYVNGLKKMIDAALALGTPKVMLLTDAYVLDQDVHDFIDDVSANEATGTGYTAGGLTLTTTTSTDAAANEGILDATDIAAGTISVSCCYAVIYVDTGTPATSPLLCIVDLSDGGGANLTVTGLTWSSSGIAALTAA